MATNSHTTQNRIAARNGDAQVPAQNGTQQLVMQIPDAQLQLVAAQLLAANINEFQQFAELLKYQQAEGEYETTIELIIRE